MTIVDPHLDVDQLSAAVDGAGDPAVAAHLLVCLACREQVDLWRRTLAPLRSLPVAPAGVDPVPAALASWAARPGDDQGLEDPAPTGAVPADLGLRRAALAQSAAELRRGTSRPDSHPARRRRSFHPPAGLAAALVVIVVLAAAVVGIRAAGHGGGTSSASKASSSAPTLVAPQARAASGATSAPVAAGSGSSDPAVPSYAGTRQLTAALRPIVTARPDTPVPAGTPCLRQARRLAAGDAGVGSAPPSYSEAVSLAGVAGRVYVFGASHGHVAVVVRATTCALLATVSF